MREAGVQGSRRLAGEGSAHPQQMGVPGRVGVVEPEPAGRAHHRAPRELVFDPVGGERTDYCLHAEDVDRGGVTVQHT